MQYMRADLDGAKAQQAVTLRVFRRKLGGVVGLKVGGAA